MKKLKCDRIIEVENGQIVVLDEERLKSYALGKKLEY